MKYLEWALDFAKGAIFALGLIKALELISAALE